MNYLTLSNSLERLLEIDLLGLPRSFLPLIRLEPAVLSQNKGEKFREKNFDSLPS